MENIIGTIRTFHTKHFAVVVDAVVQDGVDLSWDEDGTVTKGIESGNFIVFCARARVFHDTLGEIASDYLSDCIYESLEQFEDHRECAKATRETQANRIVELQKAGVGLDEAESEAKHIFVGSYFADMVKVVCIMARNHIRSAKEIYVRPNN